MFSRACPRVLRGSALRSSPLRTPPTHTRSSQVFRPHIEPWPRPRHITTRAAAKKLFKENPFSVSLASFLSEEPQPIHPTPAANTCGLSSILFGMGALVYANYIYNSYIVGAFHNFPEPVAIKLRRALYFTNQDLQPKEAVKYYRQALEVADELGMDPFSNEILGVKFQLASLMEKIKQYNKAIDILEIVRSDCLKWIDQLGGKEENRGKRTRVLGKTVATSVKLGDLYAIQQEHETAEARLVWAVETVLKEQKRRETEGVKEGEGEWMSNEEIGGALECKHHHSQTPLYPSAITNTLHSSRTPLRRKGPTLSRRPALPPSPGHDTPTNLPLRGPQYVTNPSFLFLPNLLPSPSSPQLQLQLSPTKPPPPFPYSEQPLRLPSPTTPPAHPLPTPAIPLRPHRRRAHLGPKIPLHRLCPQAPRPKRRMRYGMCGSDAQSGRVCGDGWGCGGGEEEVRRGEGVE